MHPVLVTAPESLIAERLAQRGRETEAQIRRRLQHNCLLADCGTGKDCAVIVNDSTVQAAAERFFLIIAPLSSLKHTARPCYGRAAISGHVRRPYQTAMRQIHTGL